MTDHPPPREITMSTVRAVKEYQKVTARLRRKFGGTVEWMDAAREVLGPDGGAFLLKMHQLATLVWMAEHPREGERVLVVIVPDPVPELPPGRLTDMIKRLDPKPE